MGRVGRAHALPPRCGLPLPVLAGGVRAFHASHTRRRHSFLACGKGGKGVRALTHAPHRPPARLPSTRARFPRFPQDPAAIPVALPRRRTGTLSHPAPAPPPPGAGKNKMAANSTGLRPCRMTHGPLFTPLHSHGESTGRTGRRSAFQAAPALLVGRRGSGFRCRARLFSVDWRVADRPKKGWRTSGSLPTCPGGMCERGHSPFHKKAILNRNSPKRAPAREGVSIPARSAGRFGRGGSVPSYPTIRTDPTMCPPSRNARPRGAKRRAVRETGLSSLLPDNPN